jgi:hypothetical protein
MRVIELLVVGNLDYKDAIVNILSTPKDPAGASYDEIIKLLPIIEKVKAGASGGKLSVESSEFAIILDRVSTTRYNFISQDIIDMIDNIGGSPTKPRD